jgi:hypothetical protein
MATSPSGFRSVEATLILDAKGIGLTVVNFSLGPGCAWLAKVPREGLRWPSGRIARWGARVETDDPASARIELIDDRGDPLVIELSIGTDDASACTITPYGDVAGMTRLSPQESTPRHPRYTSVLVFRRPAERPRD